MRPRNQSHRDHKTNGGTWGCAVTNEFQIVTNEDREVREGLGRCHPVAFSQSDFAGVAFAGNHVRYDGCTRLGDGHESLDLV